MKDKERVNKELQLEYENLLKNSEHEHTLLMKKTN